ncbi:O-methyltransferase [Mucilaginibacter sp. PAMB04168]|uniref:O-methyltransferase n=1 Tax=Mucilaginibacter sp. PAMB04168 TaxID=3138567 RepID=UPI0031F634FE
MEILDPNLQLYLETHCDTEPEVLKKINRNTHLKQLKPHMLSGHYQGRLLSMLSKLVQPKLVLEVGTFTGYATICLAEGLAEDGKVHTIEGNPELEETLRNNFELADVQDRIELYIGDAREVIFGFTENIYDLAFIDADKKSNLAYFELIIDKLRPGGLIIIDNVLWKGKVYGDAKDADTELFRKLNDTIAVNTQVEKIILPVRDGVLIIRKK